MTLREYIKQQRLRHQVSHVKFPFSGLPPQEKILLAHLGATCKLHNAYLGAAVKWAKLTQQFKP